MPRHHIGKKTNDQCHRLDKQTQYLHRHQDEFNSERNSGRIENMTPIMFLRTCKDHDK